MVKPRAFLTKAFNLLGLGGFHLFQGPRYDWQIYTPPSMDHLGILAKCGINLLIKNTENKTRETTP